MEHKNFHYKFSTAFSKAFFTALENVDFSNGKFSSFNSAKLALTESLAEPSP
jgi:hypothetical protein